jgi:hypothetical protein
MVQSYSSRGKVCRVLEAKGRLKCSLYGNLRERSFREFGILFFSCVTEGRESRVGIERDGLNPVGGERGEEMTEWGGESGSENFAGRTEGGNGDALRERERERARSRESEREGTYGREDLFFLDL